MRIPSYAVEGVGGKRFVAGQIIFEETEPGDVMYVIRQGEVELQVQGRVVDTLGPGGVFGEMALIDSRGRSASAVARTECELLPVDEKRFLSMVQQVPYFSLEIMRLMCDRLRRGNPLRGEGVSERE